MSFMSARTFFCEEEKKKKMPTRIRGIFCFCFYLENKNRLATDLAKGRKETSRSEIRDTCAVLGS